MTDNSVDSIVTDPPYELGFMGKKWDSTGIAYNEELWKECLRVLKPGGHLLAFGGTRTYHRMTCAIEDAGFEIRDCIQWNYGSGFPKSHNISKAIDKRLGGTPKQGRFLYKNGKTAGGARIGQLAGGAKHYETIPDTEQARQWDGWRTALKPANEPIVLARKPISEKTIAENVMKWGTGGLNIDGCRIEHDEKIKTTQRSGRQNAIVMTDSSCGFDNTKNNIASANPKGRFPANVILDEEAGALLDQQSGVLKSGDNCVRTRVGSFLENGGLGKPGDVQVTYGDSGGASRFFYCAKASKKERGEGNNHPTVKPLSLMRYLVRLITPPNGIVLDPFAGSGTTLLASDLEGFKYLGIEREPEYVAIIKKRVGVV